MFPLQRKTYSGGVYSGSGGVIATLVLAELGHMIHSGVHGSRMIPELWGLQ